MTINLLNHNTETLLLCKSVITTTQLSNHTPGHLSQGNENLCSHKNLSTHVYSFILNSLKWETSRCSSMGDWLSKPWLLWTESCPPKTHVESPTHSVTAFGDRAYKEATKIEWVIRVRPSSDGAGALVRREITRGLSLPVCM